MPIPRNARMLLTLTTPLTRLLPHQHLTMRLHAVPLMLGHIATARRLPRRRRPRQVIPAHLDVIVGELAQLVVVHAEQLRLLGRAEVQAGDEVDGVGEDVREGEGPARGGEDVRELYVELFVLVVDPAARDDARVDAVEADDVGCAEEGVGHEAEHACDGVLGEDVHGVVYVEPEFDWGEGRLVSDALGTRLEMEGGKKEQGGRYFWCCNCTRCLRLHRER